MNVKRNYFKGKSEYTVFYQSIRGVDLSSSHSEDRTRLAYIENMYRDYDGDESDALVSVPGFRHLCKFTGRINALYEKKNSDGVETIIAHAGDGIYDMRFTDSGLVASRLTNAKDTKSAAVSVANDLYIFDGETITRIKDGDTAHKVGEEGAVPYAPVTYKDGVPYEQKNLLTDTCRERYTVSAAGLVAYGTPELIYKITDTESLTCDVMGVEAGFAGDEINIPSFVTIGDLKYRVEQIVDGAFKGNDLIAALNVHEGLIRIGKEAFANCRALSYARFPDTVLEIADNALNGCERLGNVFLGKSLKRIGEGAFDGCISMSYVDYAGSESDFSEIENHEAILWTTNFNRKRRLMNITVPIRTAARSIGRVTIGEGEPASFAGLKGADGVIRAVSIRVPDVVEIDGKEVEITLDAMPDCVAQSKDNADLLSYGNGACTGPEAVLGCTLAQTFDGRIFLSGNPKLPNTVIYSSRDETGRNNPLYYGIYNYFNDGIGAYPVIALLATADSLAVFKEDDDGCGSIFYHVPKDTDSSLVPKIYPVSYIHSGICASGEAISFYDDPVFVTRKGICALDKKAINLDRSIACRSHNINPELLPLSQKDIRLARWCGYLVVAAGGKMFLGDSRATFRHECGAIEYEWFYLNGIGSYEGDATVYRYTSQKFDGFYMPKDPDAIVTDTVYSHVDNNGRPVYFTVCEGKRYRAFPTDMKTGGKLYHATALLSINEERLFFGTENGCVMTFNNDMRGIDADGAQTGGRGLHPKYYGFGAHAPRYAIKTAYDNCSVPHLEKNSVKNSLTLKCGVMGGAKLKCEVACDNGEWNTVATLPNTDLDFSSLDFASLSFAAASNTTVPIEEKQKAWVEKQISVYAEDYKAPVKIYGLTYRFTIKGRIRKNR